jgi:uncharacterized protein (DUF2062 family)
MTEQILPASPDTHGLTVARPSWRPRAWLHWLEQAAIASGSPRRTAAAFAFGVFLSFSPLLGLQVAIGMGIAFALRLSRGTVFLGLCTNLPAIMVPWYAATTAAGALVLQVPLSPEFGARLSGVLDIPAYTAAFWLQTFDLLWPLGSAFVVGSTAGALLLAVAAYVSTSRLLAQVHGTRVRAAARSIP